MAKQVNTRLDNLENRVNPESKPQVTVNWDEDPQPSDDPNVIVVEWGEVEDNDK